MAAASATLTPRRVAQAIGVSESSLKRWCDRGLISSVKTAGGHRRLALDAVIDFLRASGHPLVRPELLGLPAHSGTGERTLERARDELYSALTTGNEEWCRRLVLDLHLAGQRLSRICDQVVAPVLHRLGEQWDCGQIEIYHERRACELSVKTLHELGRVLPPPPTVGPPALGGSPEGDLYTIPTTMVELVLKENGWNGQNMGAHLPLPTLATAVKEQRPKLCWVSVSHLADESEFLVQYERFYADVGGLTAIIVGGRALTESLRRQMQYTAYCDNLQHLESLVRTLRAPVKAARSARGAGS